MKELNLDDLDVVAGGVSVHALGLTGGGAGSDIINSHIQQSASGAGMSGFVGDLLNTPVIGQAITGLMHSFEGSGTGGGLGQLASQVAPLISAFTGGQGASGLAGALGPIINAFTHGTNGTNGAPGGNV